MCVCVCVCDRVCVCPRDAVPIAAPCGAPSFHTMSPPLVLSYRKTIAYVKHRLLYSGNKETAEEEERKDAKEKIGWGRVPLASLAPPPSSPRRCSVQVGQAAHFERFPPRGRVRSMGREEERKRKDTEEMERVL